MNILTLSSILSFLRRKGENGFLPQLKVLKKLPIIIRVMDDRKEKRLHALTKAKGIFCPVLFLFLASGCAGGPAPQPFSYGPVGPMSVMGPAPIQAPHDIQHIVGPSETLWRIAKTYDVDMGALLRVNNLADPTKIQKGQVLLIPGTRGPKPFIPLYPNSRWTHIVVHHTASDVGDAYSIDSIHHQRGWDRGLGYHFLINNGTNGKADGQIQVGPRWIKQINGAHAKDDGMNERGIGLGIVGNFSEHQLSNAEMESLVFLVKTLQEYYKIPSRNVIGHRDVRGANTECPGKLFPWAEFKRRIS